MKPIRIIQITMLFLFGACGQIQQEITNQQLEKVEDEASSKLIGSYSGTITFKIEYSALNLGIEDQVASYNEVANILKTSDNQIILQFTDGMIHFDAITTVSNATVFVIPQQSITNSEGNTSEIIGLNQYVVDGYNYAGGLFIITNQLKFAYVTYTESDLGEYGVVSVPINYYFEMTKLQV